MDKSVVQKFTIIMSMFIAVFATVFVCGNIVNGGVSDSYIKPLTQTGSIASYSDISVNSYEPGNSVSRSDTYSDGNVTIVRFIDDEETEPTETVENTQNDIFYDDEYLYVTTVTTTQRKTTATTIKARVTTTTIRKKTTKTTTKTTTAKKTTTTSKSTTLTTTTTNPSTTASTSASTASTVTTASSSPTQYTTASSVTQTTEATTAETTITAAQILSEAPQVIVE